MKNQINQRNQRNLIRKGLTGLTALVIGGFLSMDAEAKVTKVYRRANDTIIKIYDDEIRESVEEEGKIGAYLYPVRFCEKCQKNHYDKDRRKVELQFQTESGRIVDYLPQTKRPE